jgi:hypothetical protein
MVETGTIATLLLDLRAGWKITQKVYSDLCRLLQELEAATAQLEVNKEEKQKDRFLEGQIRIREPDSILASKLQSATVSSPDNQFIGDVNDLIIKTDGTVAGLIVRIGDDQGRGKNIALKIERFELTPEPDGRAHVMLSAKKEELEHAPDFKFTQKHEHTSAS